MPVTTSLPELQTYARPPSLAHELWRLAVLAVPIVVSLAGATLIIVVDTIMIAPLGTLALAAAAVTATFFMVISSALYGFVSLIGVRMAEAHGSADAAALSQTTRTGLWVAGITGSLAALGMTALLPALPWFGQPPEVLAGLRSYWLAMCGVLVPFTLFYTLKSLFDAVGAPWIGVALAAVAVLLNVPANWLLIHGIGGWPGLGLLGAGLASLLSMSVPLAAAWVIWRRSALMAPARRPVPHWSRTETRLHLREGGAISLGYIGEAGAYATATLMMGGFGAAALAAQRIVSSIGEVLYMVPFGVAVAVSIRVGQAVGSGQTARLPRMGRAALLLIIGWTVLMMGLVLLVGRPIAQALSSDAAVVALASVLFVATATMQIADGIQGTMLGAARGLTDNRVPVAITLAAYWAVGLPLAYALAFMWGVGPLGIWIGYGTGLVLAGSAITWRFFRRAAVLASAAAPPAPHGQSPSAMKKAASEGGAAS